MGKLHELLAAEKTVVGSANAVMKETGDKFRNENFFRGQDKSLRMIVESPENAAMEAAAAEHRALPSTVGATLEYALGMWADAEDLLASKNVTNTKALADIEFRGRVVASGVPVDELMGLEARLERMKADVFSHMPTLDATRRWAHDETDPKGVWVSGPDRTAKTQKVLFPVVLAPATDKHPAQVKEASRDEVVGTFETTHRSGAATTLQKADVLTALDELIVEIKRARQRANSVEVTQVRIGKAIRDILMGPFE